MYYIKKELSKFILTTGPDYKNHRGGIGAVLETYNHFFENFKFIPTYQPFNSNVKKFFFFFKQIPLIFGFLLKDKDIKIVHIHGSHGASLFRKFTIFFLAKYIFKKKIIYHIHSGSFVFVFNNAGMLKKWIISTLINRSDMVICLSQVWFDFFKSNFRNPRIVIINNVVNEPDITAKIFLPQKSSSNFLFLGLINNKKGLFDLLEVILANAGFFKNRLKLYIGGAGEVDRLNNYVKDHNLEDIVEFVGWVTAKAKASLLAESDIFILPSYIEGLPISILEAMSCGLPIISTDVGSIPEVLENNVNGFIFNPGDKIAMENAIFTFLNNPDKITDFGKASLQKIKPYLPQHVAMQLINCYQALLS